MSSLFYNKYPIPNDFQQILHDFTKEIVRNKPKDILDFSIHYFYCLENNLKFNFNDNNHSTDIKQIENTKHITEYNSDTSVNDIDTITFGSYPQSDVTGKTKEPIEWIVLDRDEENKKALLLSKYILDCKPYNDEYKEVTWETCSLRKWLNRDFYNIAFNDSDKIYITLTSLINNDNVDYGSNGGNNTSDNVFLLSIDEIKHYLKIMIRIVFILEKGYMRVQLSIAKNYQLKVQIMLKT